MFFFVFKLFFVFPIYKQMEGEGGILWCLISPLLASWRCNRVLFDGREVTNRVLCYPVLFPSKLSSFLISLTTDGLI